MGITPNPGRDIGIFKFSHYLFVNGGAIAFFHNEIGLAILPIRKKDVNYYVPGESYDLQAWRPGTSPKIPE